MLEETKEQLRSLRTSLIVELVLASTYLFYYFKFPDEIFSSEIFGIIFFSKIALTFGFMTFCIVKPELSRKEGFFLVEEGTNEINLISFVIFATFAAFILCNYYNIPIIVPFVFVFILILSLIPLFLEYIRYIIILCKRNKTKGTKQKLH